MKTKDFYYALPPEQIAQEPLADRTASRLMVLDRKTKEISHRHFWELPTLLQPGDCLVLNDTRVMPARLYGKKQPRGGIVEFLLLVRKELDIWEVLVRPGKRARVGDQIAFGDGRLKAEVLDIVEGGNRLVQFHYDGVFETLLEELGEMPLPPYITKRLADKERYQTVYATEEGSAAAPTAGLHFTQPLLETLVKQGIHIAHLTLHVGLGTFRPVQVEDPLQHQMHSEYYVVTENEAAKINAARAAGGRIIAVGTTSARTLASVTDTNGIIQAKSGWTNIFLYPGVAFRGADCLITNFHLPESTLIMLVAAMAGTDFTLQAYQNAVDAGYRFFSFGDAMLIL